MKDKKGARVNNVNASTYLVVGFTLRKSTPTYHHHQERYTLSTLLFLTLIAKRNLCQEKHFCPGGKFYSKPQFFRQIQSSCFLNNFMQRIMLPLERNYKYESYYTTHKIANYCLSWKVLVSKCMIFTLTLIKRMNLW